MTYELGGQHSFRPRGSGGPSSWHTCRKPNNGAFLVASPRHISCRTWTGKDRLRHSPV